MNNEKSSISITISNEYVEQIIDWPILHKTEKAVQVDTAGGKLWIPLWQWESINVPFSRSIKGLQAKVRAEKVDLFINMLSQFARADSVRVTQSGKGSTLKSSKYKVKVWRYMDKGKPYEQRDEVERCFTLPVSQITSDNVGELRAPTWLFKKHLAANERLVLDSWDGLGAITKQFSDVVESMKQQTLEYHQKRAIESKARVEEAKERMARLKKKHISQPVAT